MAVIVKLLRNTELTTTIKIKSDAQGGQVDVTKELLCFKPEKGSCKSDESQRFQEVTDKSEFNILSMQWAGHNQEGSGRLYRGGTDLEHEIMSFCVGDTCQLDLEGQENAPDIEYNTEDMTFQLTGELTIYLRIRKHFFKNYSGEHASYGAFEDESVPGPAESHKDDV